MNTPKNKQDLSRRQIFKLFRKSDQSHLYPIKGRFNATNRAINRLRKFEFEYGQKLQGLELWLTIDTELTRIVNEQV
jgi:hypothetical protein